MVICAAFGCNSRSDTNGECVSFFSFPAEQKRRKLWSSLLNRDYYVPNVNSKLCSKHFTDDQFVRSRAFAESIGYDGKFLLRLQADAIPSIFFRPGKKSPERPRPSAIAIEEKKFKLRCTEVKNSYGMEKEGLIRSLRHLMGNQLEIGDLITDRHSSIKKFVREEHPEINHWFDVWHVAKGVYKKLEAAAKKKGCEKVKDWARSISNHLYWCASSSKGDGDLLLQKWLSILNHVTDVHEGHGDKFPRCEHAELEDRDWMMEAGKPFEALEKVVCGRLLVTDIKKLSPDEQTSSLEAFHSVVCNFAPKAVHFQHAQMEARVCLAVLHFNENAGRKQAVTKAGAPRYAISYKKARKGAAVATEIKEVATYGYVDEIMTVLLTRRDLNKSYRKALALSDRGDIGRPCPISQSTPKRLSKEEVIRIHRSRFNK